MKKAYLVYEIVDVDGGFGDAIETTCPIAVYLDENSAKTYVKDNSKPEIYDYPYDPLKRGELKYEEIDFID